MSVQSWLLDSDPAIRWQVLRDLTDSDPGSIAAERARIPSEGWGGKLLSMQSRRGYWGGRNDRGWMTTVDALKLLRDFGADPGDRKVRTAIGRVRDHLKWEQLDGRPFFDGETEPCINGRILASGAYFGQDTTRLVERLLSDQLKDGGWNCDAPPSKCSSFHSTICVLEGLLEYERSLERPGLIRKARLRAQNYLLKRHMIRSLSTGEIIDRRWTRFGFPTVWNYDVLRGLDYMRDAKVKPDDRVSEAVGIVEQRRHQNGRWPLNQQYLDRIGFPMEAGVGSRSHWNTLRALRVLNWAGKPRIRFTVGPRT